jgi:RHS repeat-associated protein
MKKTHGRFRMSRALKLGLFALAFLFLAAPNALAATNVVTNGPLGTTSQEISNPTNLPLLNKASGALDYSYPIQIPPGRNNFQPSLKLQYNSQEGKDGSIFGYGWSINIPYITRVNKAGSDSLYTTDHPYFESSLSGELVLAKTSVSSTMYVSRVDSGDFLKYTFSNNQWTVVDKQGNQYQFGYDASARQDNPDGSQVFKWMLENEIDTNNNTISYDYYKQSGQIYPADITYGGISATDTFKIVFQREARQDELVSYSTSFPVATYSRINQIQTFIAGGLADQWDLNYTTGTNGFRSILHSITQTGVTGSGSATVLPPTTFGSGSQDNSGNVNFSRAGLALPKDPLLYLFPGSYDFVDVNGDGYADLIDSFANYLNSSFSSQKTYLNDGHGGWVFSPAYQPPVPFGFVTVGITTSIPHSFVDVNGDGLLDLVYNHQIYLNTGNGWSLSSVWIISNFFSPAFTPLITDVNGDGLPDIISSGAVYLNNGSSWNQIPTTWNFPPVSLAGTDGSVKIGDVNGDGILDILQSSAVDQFVVGFGGVRSPVYTTVTKAWLGDGRGNYYENSGYTPPVVFQYFDNRESGCGASCLFDTGVIMADVNGDGLPDLLQATDGNRAGAAFKRVFLNTGKGWSTPIPISMSDSFSGPYIKNYAISDFNGDGAVDVYWPDTGVLDVSPSNSFSTDRLTTIVYPGNGVSNVVYQLTAKFVDNQSRLLNPKLPQNIPAVSRILTYNGTGEAAADDSYSYQGGSYYFNNGLDRKFAGFAKITDTDGAGNVTNTFYHTGSGTDVSHGEVADNFWKIGEPYRVEQYDSGGQLYQKTIDQWVLATSTSSPSPGFVNLAQTVQSNFDGTPNHKDKAVTYLYDDTNGNQIQKVEYGQVVGNDDGTFTDVGGDTFITNISYAANAGSNVAASPASVVVTDQNNDKVKDVRYYYDGLPLGSIGVGNQTKEEDWKSGAQLVAFPVAPSEPSSDPSTGTIKILVVAGGGGGANNYSPNISVPGGGGGGVLYDVAHTVLKQTYAVTVGNGGAAGTNGQNSVFDNLTTIGGGGAYYVGGSGGGAAGYGGINGPAGTAGQGNKGGDGGTNGGVSYSGGGGGAGSAGGNAAYFGITNGTGGEGIFNSISGSGVFYAGGGGVGSGPAAATSGGIGGGGPGGSNGANGVNGTANTGGGGGGGGSTGHTGGSGGSGVVIISFITQTYNYTATGAYTASTDGPNTVLTFIGNGTFTIASISSPIPIISKLLPSPPYVPPPAGVYATTQKSYNSYGLVTRSTDANGNATNYSYDSFNLYPATVTNALNQSTQYTYDYRNGKVEQTTDPNGNVFKNSYDGLGRPLYIEQPDLSSPSSLVVKTNYSYDDRPGNIMVQKIDHMNPASAIDTLTYYDGLNRPIQTRKSLDGLEGGTTETKDIFYDVRGQVQKQSLPYFSAGLSKTSATGNSALYTNFTYDPLSRVLTASNAVGTTSNNYSPWKTTTIDPKGNTKDSQYDAYGNLVEVDEHNAGATYATTYAYDGLNDLIATTDPLGNIRTFTYNGLGRRLTAQDLHAPADTTFGTYTYTYDDAGNLTSRLDPNSQTTNYTYDNLNRPLTEDFTGQPGTEVTYAYDAGVNGIGHLTGVTTAAITQTNMYNAVGGLQSESKVINGATYTTAYDYDTQGNQILITNPDGSQVKNTYNPAGLLESTQRKEATDTAFTDVVSNYDYSPTDQPATIAYANGSVTTNTYDPAKLYRLVKKVTTIAGGDHAQDLSYTYDNDGNITQILDASNTDTAKTATYAYDDLNRLTSAAITAVAPGQSEYAQSYSYNAIGDILSRTETIGTSTPVTYAYAYEGNTGGSFANPHGVTSITGPATASVSTELLPSPWNLIGNNGAAELYQPVDANVLNGKQSITVTYDLHGLCALGGDASALILDQNGWKYVSLSNYGVNCKNGSQTATIPLSDFTGLDTTAPLTGLLHTRFWNSGAFTVGITSVTVNTPSSSGITTLTYDNNGNELSKGTDLTNTWDYNNRLIKAVAGDSVDVYTYDASGERISSVTNSHNTTSTPATPHPSPSPPPPSPQPPAPSGPSELSQTTLATDPSLISYYRMEGNSSDSKGINNGLDTNVTYSVGSGRFGQGTHYNGTASVDTLVLPAFPHSISGWFNSSHVPDNDTIWSNLRYVGGVYYGFTMRIEAATGDAWLFDGITWFAGSHPVNDGKWHHLALNRLSTNTQVYVDGVLDISTFEAPHPDYPGQKMRLGDTTNDFRESNQFFGDQDDVAVFSRLLTPAEISSLYSGSGGASATPAPTPSTSSTPTVSPGLSETFSTPPDYSNNWAFTATQGNPTVTYAAGDLKVQAAKTGDNGQFVSKATFTGDSDTTFAFNHQGFGRTNVGLYYPPTNSWLALAALDTDDTNYLNFSSATSSTEWKYAGTPYMNRTVAIRMKVTGNQIQFYADGILKETMPFSAPGPYALAVSVSSVSWKSGDNTTDFASVAATGNAAAAAPTSSPPAGTISITTSGYTGTVLCQLNGASTPAPTIFRNRAADSYALVCFPPAGYTISSITPSASQTLTDGGTINFAVALTSASPIAGAVSALALGHGGIRLRSDIALRPHAASPVLAALIAPTRKEPIILAFSSILDTTTDASTSTVLVVSSTIPVITFTGGTNGVAASTTITIPSALDSGGDRFITIDGVIIDLSSQEGHPAKTPRQIAATIAATPGFTSGISYHANGPYTVSNLSADPTVTFTRDNAGAAGNVGLVLADANYTGGVDAERWITVNSVPEDGVVLTVGTCKVTFNTGATEDLDCSDNAAAINTTTEATATLVASKLSALTNVSDSGHGILSVRGGGLNTIFTTAGPEESATEIAFSLSSGASITGMSSDFGVVASTSTLPAITFAGGVDAVAASASVVIPSGLAANAADHTVTIDGVTIDLGTSALTAEQVAAAIAAGSFTGKDYTVANPSGADLAFTKSTAGDAGNMGLTIQDGTYDGTPQVITPIPPAPIPPAVTTSTSTSAPSTVATSTAATSTVATTRTVITIYPSKLYNTDGTTPTKHIFGNGTEIGTVTGTGVDAIARYVHTDQLTGSNIVTNSSGTKDETIDYFPFGSIRIDSGSYNDQRKYAGHEYDADTGLSYMDARYYDPVTGRFLSQDPAILAIGDFDQLGQITDRSLQKLLANPQNLNSYSYARNNPLVNIDSSGQYTEALVPVLFPALEFGLSEIAGPAVVGGAAAVLVPVGFNWTLADPAALNMTTPDTLLSIPQSGTIQEYKSGAAFTPKTKAEIDRQNKARNNGKSKCDNCDKEVKPGEQSEKDKTPSPDEKNFDHKTARKFGGDNSPDNGSVKCRGCNLRKGSQSEEQFKNSPNNPVNKNSSLKYIP